MTTKLESNRIQQVNCQHKQCDKRFNLVKCKKCKKLVCFDCITDHSFECQYESEVVNQTW